MAPVTLRDSTSWAPEEDAHHRRLHSRPDLALTMHTGKNSFSNPKPQGGKTRPPLLPQARGAVHTSIPGAWRPTEGASLSPAG